MTSIVEFQPRDGDALIMVDVQNDFLPGGSLAVPDGDAIIAPLNNYVSIFSRDRLPVFATRDWHTVDHCSFVEQGGIWPAHCVAGSPGARFSTQLDLPERVIIVSKADTRDKDAYSGFAGTELAEDLRARNVKRLFVGGLATDYCVLNTVLDGIQEGFEVLLLEDAIRAVDVQPDDGRQAVQRMLAKGATPVDFRQLAA